MPHRTGLPVRPRIHLTDGIATERAGTVTGHGISTLSEGIALARCHGFALHVAKIRGMRGMSYYYYHYYYYYYDYYCYYYY